MVRRPDGLFGWLIAFPFAGYGGGAGSIAFAILDTNGSPILDTNNSPILDTNGTTKP